MNLANVLLTYVLPLEDTRDTKEGILYLEPELPDTSDRYEGGTLLINNPPASLYS